MHPVKLYINIKINESILKKKVILNFFFIINNVILFSLGLRVRMGPCEK